MSEDKVLHLTNQKADAKIGFKLSHEEKDLIIQQANEMDMTISKYIRIVLAQSIVKDTEKRA